MTRISQHCVYFCLALAVQTLAASSTKADHSRYPLTDPRISNHVLGNTQWTVVHWLSHAIFEFEDSTSSAATEPKLDELATLLLLEEREIDSERARPAIDTMLGLTSAVASWVATAERRDKSVASKPLTEWGGHHLSLERYRDVICLLFGADEKLFAQPFLLADMGPSRAQPCRDRYAAASASWSHIIVPFGAPPSGQPAQAGRMTVEFQPVSQPDMEEFRALVQDAKLVTGLAEQIDASQVLKEDIRLTFMPCDAPNSGWDARERRITVCYELLGTFPKWAYE